MAKRSLSKFKKIENFLLKRDFLVALIVAILVILAALSLGWYNNKVVPVSGSPVAHYLKEPNNPLRFMSDWDGPDYLKISHTGYTDVDSTNFFPLYPILVHIVNQIISSTLYSALLVSWVSLVGAIYFFIKITKQLYNVPTNETIRAVRLFVLFPTGVFLLATYTESLFAFLALAAIYYTFTKRYLLSVIFTIFATATHVTGMFLILLLALILIEQKEKIQKVVVFVVLGSLGLITYSAYLFNKFGRPLAFITAQKSHGWVQIHKGYIHNIETTFNTLNIFFIILIIISTIYWWKKRKSFSIYSFSFLLIPLLGGQFGGFDRYVLMAFPIQFMLYEELRKKPLSYAIMLSLFSIFWAYTVMQYAGGYTGS